MSGEESAEAARQRVAEELRRIREGVRDRALEAPAPRSATPPPAVRTPEVPRMESATPAAEGNPSSAQPQGDIVSVRDETYTTLLASADELQRQGKHEEAIEIERLVRKRGGDDGDGAQRQYV